MPSSSVHGRGHGSHGRGGHGSVCNPPPSQTGLISHNFGSKQCDNLSIKVFLVIPSESVLTQALSSYTILANQFLNGTNHESTHDTIKQAMYNALINSL